MICTSLVNLPCFADRNFSRKAAKSELGIICCLLIFLSPKEWQTYRQNWFCFSTVCQVASTMYSMYGEMILLLFMSKNPFHHKNTTYRQDHFTIVCCDLTSFYYTIMMLDFDVHVLLITFHTVAILTFFNSTMPLTDKDGKFEHCLKSGLTKIILLLFCTQAGWQAIKEFTLILRRNKTKH